MFPTCYSILGALLTICLGLTNAQNLPTDAFVGFFPCLPNSTNITTQEDAQSCDIFVYAAAQLAFERAERELNDSSIRLDFNPTLSNASSSTEVLYDVYVNLATLEVNVPQALSRFRGSVGPQNDYVTSSQTLSITRNLGVPMVSYGLTDVRLDTYDNFYRTVPSSDTLNQARLLVLAHFRWFRIGILGTRNSSTEYAVEMNSFARLFNDFVEREVEAELSYEGFVEELPSTLAELRRLDLRIFLGFLGPEQSREVLCEASSLLYNLTSPQHVWILPSYYNPDWWKADSSNSSSCTDDQMRDILQSVIFIDPVKYPPLDTPISLLFSELLNKTRQLFPDLSPEVKLEHLLQHSRAISAYDATLLLIRSLDPELEQIDVEKLDSQIVCELCRIYPRVFIPEDNFVFCQSFREECEQDPANALNISGIEEVREVILSGYGQVLISQFIDGTHCPIMTFWPSESDQPERLTDNFQFVHRLSELIDSSDPELREELRAPNIFPGSVGCPENFTWKGPTIPVSNTLQYSSIPVWALALVGVLTVLSELLIAGLITFSIFWMRNRHVKGTSPRLNIVVLIGAAVAIPTTLINGIVVSGTRYQLDPTVGTVICQFNLWIPRIGETLFIGGILVKIFRLYRIFHNKALRIKLKHLSDRDLIITVCLSVIPVLFFLLVWNAITLHMYNAANMEQPETLQYVRITKCASSRLSVDQVMFSLLRTYQALGFLFAIGLPLFITRAPRNIKFDLLVVRTALAVSFVFVLVGIIGSILVLRGAIPEPLSSELNWFFNGLLNSFVMMATVPVLFLYQVLLVIRDYSRKLKEEYYPKVKNRQSYHRQLLAEIAELTESIAKKEAAIRELKGQRKFMIGYETQV